MMIKVKLLITLVFVPFVQMNGQVSINLVMPDLFSEYPNVRDIAITSDGNEIYFTLDSYKSEIGAIAFIKKQGEDWSAPEIVSFSGNYRDLEPALSQDGKTMYFASNRPIHNDSISAKDYDIWFVDRTENGWSEPQNIGETINTSHNEFYPSIANNGNLYFTSDRPTEIGRENIYVSEYIDESYTEPIPLGENINSKFYEFNAFIAPDESFLIFSTIRRGEGLGGGDLYISFNQNGWQKAQPLQFVNTKYLDFCPFVDTTSGLLYFTSQKTEIPPHEEKGLDISFFQNLSKSDIPKGLNRIYSVEFEKVLPQ